MQTGFWWENANVKDHLENPGVDRKRGQKSDT